MSSNFYHIDNLGEVFSLTIEGGFRQEFFDNYDCDSNGDLIEAIVRYLIRINNFDDSDVEFDSELDMFAVYCENEEKIRELAEILERTMYNDLVIDDAMNSPEVKEEMGICDDISKALKKAKAETENSDDPVTFLEKFNEFFRS